MKTFTIILSPSVAPTLFSIMWGWFLIWASYRALRIAFDYIEIRWGIKVATTPEFQHQGTEELKRAS